MRNSKTSRASKLWRTLTLIALGSAAMSASALNDPHTQKFDRFTVEALKRSNVLEPVGAIVQTKAELSRAETAKLRSLGAKVTRELSLIGSYAVSVPIRSLRAIAALQFVSRVSMDVVATKSDEFTVERSFADAVYQQHGLSGKGVSVAVLDSGITDSPDLRDPASGRSRIIKSVNFVPGTTSTADHCGHGTHVAGIVGGNGAMSSDPDCFRTFYGIARNVNLVNVRVLDAKGQATVSTLVSAIQWVVANRTEYKIRVMNLSLGHSVGESYKTDPLCLAVEKAWKAGIVVVVAAGNTGRSSNLAIGPKADNEGYGTAYGSVSSPGNSPYVITVGAMKQTGGTRGTDTAATYSSRGPSRLDHVLKPDIMAPGNQVVSLRRPLSFLELTSPNNALPRSQYASSSLLRASDYFKLSGTSMAAPVVAGAAALMLQQEPGLTPDTVKLRLMLTADKWLAPNGVADACTYGAGYLDIKGAVASNAIARSTAFSPVLKIDAAGDISMDLDPTVEGERAIWGSTVTDLRAVWGSRAIWGSNTLNGNRALWGHSVWADRAIWGSDFLTLGIGPILLNGE